MLSLSADLTESTVDLNLINGDENAAAGDIPYGVALLRFAEAFASRDESRLDRARTELLAEAGAEVLVDAAGVAANFQRMVRIADSTGIPLDNLSAAISHKVVKQLDLTRFASSANTPEAGIKRKLLSWIARPLAIRKFRRMGED